MSNSEILLYKTEDGEIKIDVFFDADNLWLTQKLMAELFECSTDNISLHLKNIFKEGELDKNSVVEDYSLTAHDGKKDRIKQDNKYLSDFDMTIKSIKKRFFAKTCG